MFIYETWKFLRFSCFINNSFTIVDKSIDLGSLRSFQHIKQVDKIYSRSGY